MNRRSLSEPAPQTLRERLKSTTIETILNAAEEVFADRGLHAAHMGEIAARAGVSVGTLYNHFEDREALLAGLMEARKVELLAQLDAGALRAAGGRAAVERLREMVETMLVHKSQHRKFMQILLQGEIGSHASTFHAASRPSATLQELHARLEKVVRQGIKEGSLRQDIEGVAPMFLMGMVRSLALRDAMRKSPGDPAADAATLFDFFMKGAGK